MKKSTKGYFIITAILAADTILFLWKGISLATDWADKLLFWVWFFSTFVVVFSEIKKKWAKIYGSILTVLVVISCLPMMIPILTVFVSMAPHLERNEYYDDGQLKLYLTSKSVIAKPYVAVKKNYVIFEQEFYEMDMTLLIEDNKHYNIDDAILITRLEDKDNHIMFQFDFEDASMIHLIKK